MMLPHLLARLGALLLVAVGRVAADKSHKTNESDCDCFLTNGSSRTFFQKHMFFDFRSLGEYAGAPDVLTSSVANQRAPPSSDYFKRDEWTKTWELQTWDNLVGSGNKLSSGESILMVNSPNNVFLEKNKDKDAASDTYMTMRTKRLPKFQTAAEFESTEKYQFVSVRMLSRTIGAPGAVTAMFTYLDSKKLADVQEADIEFLTRGPRDKIQYTNQPSYSDDGDEFPKATRNASVPDGLDWTDWMVHRLDWTPDKSTWYVNGDEVASISFQTPKDPSQIIFNAWSNGGDWSGNMTTYDEAYLQIQWIEMVYNTTDGSSSGKRSLDRRGRFMRRDGDGCGTVCSIDEADVAGEVMKLPDSAAVRFASDWAWLWMCAAGISLLHWAV